MIFCLWNSYIALLNRYKWKIFQSKNKTHMIIFEIVDLQTLKEFAIFASYPHLQGNVMEWSLDFPRKLDLKILCFSECKVSA